MINKNAILNGIIGSCGDHKVLLGIASAKDLFKFSFADVLNDDTGKGYQRPYNKKHSTDFKKYILSPNTSTVPLIFNLRKELGHLWTISKKDGLAQLEITNQEPVLARVDCQHRLGELENVDIPLAFMIYIGLDLRQEMAQFYIINSKAKGLSNSLIDYHQSSLIDDVIKDAPHLFIARKLNESCSSPWFKMIKYGGELTSGLKRRTSLRMMQKCIKEFLYKTQQTEVDNIDYIYFLIENYWLAVKDVFPDEWEDPRHHLLTKGVGLYSLMGVLTDIIIQNPKIKEIDEFIMILNRLKGKVDWHSKGHFANAGGQKGAKQVYHELKRMLVL